MPVAAAFFFLCTSFQSDELEEWNPSLKIRRSKENTTQCPVPFSQTEVVNKNPTIEEEYSLKPQDRKPTLEEVYDLNPTQQNNQSNEENRLPLQDTSQQNIYSLEETHFPNQFNASGNGQPQNSPNNQQTAPGYQQQNLPANSQTAPASSSGSQSPSPAQAPINQQSAIPAQALGPLTPQPSAVQPAPAQGQSIFYQPSTGQPGASTTGTLAQPQAPLPASAAVSAQGTERATEKTILINFNNVSIIEFIRFISRISNKNFMFDDIDLDFNVTIVSEEAATVDNVMAALMQVLRVHGLTLNEQGNNILIHRNKAVNNISQVVADGLPPPLAFNELITQVFRLNTLDAERAGALIQPLVSEGALVEVLTGSNHVIVTDINSNVEKIGQLLKSLDAPISGLVIGQYVVVNALLDSLIALAERVMEPIADGKPLVFVPHIPSNSIFIVSTPFLVDRSLAVLRNLDVNVGVTRIFSGDSLRFSGGAREGEAGQFGTGGVYGEGGVERGFIEGILQEGGVIRGPLPSGSLESRSPWSSDLPEGHIDRIKFFIHKLRYRRGEQIMDALQRVGISLQETGTGNLDLVSTIQSIQWIESSNSLVFTGTIEAVAKVKELIEEIDTPLRQVFIEMLIMETDLDDSLNYSVNWGTRFDNKGDTAGAQGFISEVSTLSNALDSAIPGSTINVTGLARADGYHLGVVGRNVSHGGLSFDTIGALVTAFHDKNRVDILMNPKLLVEDNTTAEIFVGINTAFQISSIANDRGEIITNNFEFRDVGTLLRVTPLISNNDVVTLEIREEVSSLANQTNVTGALSSQSPGPQTRINRTITKVHVPNKYFLVMSGMIQDQYERRRIQVPCLGGVPLIGGLFSDKRMTDQKRNLMIFIRPQIIDTAEDIDNITRHEQDIYRNKNRTKKMWKYEVEEALDLLNLKCPEVSLHDTEIRNP